MTYAIRNSLIIAGLLILVLVASVVSKKQIQKQLKVVEKEYRVKEKELNDLKRISPDIEKEKQIIAQHDEMQKKALHRTKFILKDDNTAQTYNYLTSLTNRYCPNLDFNFTYENTDQNNGVYYNQYKIEGYTNLNDFFSFIYQLEKQSPLILVQNFEIGEEPEKAKDKKTENILYFNLTLNTYFDVNGKAYEELPFRKVAYKRLKKNPLKYVIHDPVEDPSQAELVDLDKAMLIGLTQDNILLQVDHAVSILQVGDKVAYGYLDKINWEERYALFKVNRTGIKIDRKLYIKKD